MGSHRIFLLSPAFSGGRRAAILLRQGSDVPIARQLQSGTLTLGDAFAFHYPPAFIGRGDMSRGGLLLRHAAAGQELDYEPLQPGMRPRGPRPPKLDPKDRVRA